MGCLREVMESAGIGIWPQESRTKSSKPLRVTAFQLPGQLPGNPDGLPIKCRNLHLHASQTSQKSVLTPIPTMP